ncbi:MAG: methionyl-tRNA formyltransferase [Lachnospiraceae bacterium]|nr:methionyl-tRNA formyltransferase [Lachnospiraceae bacterium]
MRAVFMGTPQFAVPILDRLVSMGIEVTSVVTQPDKPAGRGKKMVFSPVKEYALSHGISVYQPQRIRKDEEVKESIRSEDPDVIVVVAFGQIIPQDVIDIPRLGCVNVHASLLPKYRGAAPIERAIINGETMTGVTTMMIDAGLDTGDMLLKAETAIDPDETGDSLREKLAALGSDLIEKTLTGLENGTIVPEKQDGSQAGEYASMISKEEGHLNYSRPAIEIERLVRALNSHPGAFSMLDEKVLKIWDADAVSCDADEYAGAAFGEVVKVNKQDFFVKAGEGLLAVKEVQLQGKKKMDAGSFLRGYRLAAGTVLA